MYGFIIKRAGIEKGEGYRTDQCGNPPIMIPQSQKTIPRLPGCCRSGSVIIIDNSEFSQHSFQLFQNSLNFLQGSTI